MDALLSEVVSGELTRRGEIHAQRERLLPALDAILAASDTDLQRRRQVFSVLSLIGKKDPPLVYTVARIDTLSQQLLSEEDEFICRAVAQFIREAVDTGAVEKEAVPFLLDRVLRAFSHTRNVYLGYLLMRLAPHDISARNAIREVAVVLESREQRALLAAAGDAAALKSLVQDLELENRSQDPSLDRKRFRALEDLANAPDCRAIAPLIELLASTSLTVQPFADRPDYREPLGPFALPRLTHILRLYPDLVPVGQELETEDGILKWWHEVGEQLQGLDIRTSTDEIRQKKYPVHPLGQAGLRAPAGRQKRHVEEDIEQAATSRWTQQADELLTVAGRSNALTLYRKAVAKSSLHGLSSVLARLLENEHVETAELDGLLARNAASLALVREGLECETCVLPRVDNVATPLLFFPRMVFLGRLLYIEGNRFEHQGAGGQALDSYVDVVRFARHVASQKIAVGAAWSLGMEEMGLQAIRRVLSTVELPSNDYGRLCVRLSKLGDSTVSVLGTIAEECDVLRRSCAGMQIVDIVNEIRKGGATNPPDVSSLDGERLLDELVRYEETVGKWLALSYAESRKLPEPERPSCWIARNWVPRPGSLLLRKLTVMCDSRATLTLAAMCFYRARVGRLPDNANAIVPDCLPGLPTDPFTGQAFRYVERKGEVVLYSLGPDLNDDGGSARVSKPSSWPDVANGDMVYALSRNAGGG
jgi:hypothetical protein